MKIADVLLLDFDNEISNTRRTLERVPDDKPDWKSHEKSMPMGRLAMHCATIPNFGYYLLEDEGMDLAAPKRPHASLVFTTTANALQQLDDSAAKCRAALAAASDEHLAANWLFTWGQQTIFNGPRALAFRSMFFDHMIHHVAQLGVYLRLNDIPVPGLYGPSADEQWSPNSRNG
jgi:uncharacterized damage-inducible protein DinB